MEDMKAYQAFTPVSGLNGVEIWKHRNYQEASTVKQIGRVKNQGVAYRM